MQQVLVIKNKTKQLSVAIILCILCYCTGVHYYKIPRPNLFNGSTDNGTDCGNTEDSEHLYCSDNLMNTHRLVDEDTGPLHSLSSTNLHQFLAWNRTQAQPVTLRFGFNPVLSSLLSSVVLYFFNYPAQHIGLPSVALMGSGSSTFAISYKYDNNGDLRSNDSQLRNVTLSITSRKMMLITALLINLSFSGNTDIDWILLSEVDICQGKQLYSCI